MRHHRQSGDAGADTIGEGRNDPFYRQNETRRHELERARSETQYQTNWGFPEEQQKREDEAGKIRGDGRGQRGYCGRVIDHHFIDSPRAKSDRNSRISVVMDFDQNFPNERAPFKFFKRCDIRDTTSFLRIKKYMEGSESNEYTIEGRPGISREHSIEVHGTILESILGLGAIFEEHGFTEPEDMPEL
eukprot:905170-Heterocapsa_arctica.AAC.1